MSETTTPADIDASIAERLRTATSVRTVIEILSRTEHSTDALLPTAELRHALTTAGWTLIRPAGASYWIAYAPDDGSPLIVFEAEPSQPQTASAYAAPAKE